jgi:hypothetical protein
MIADAIAGFMQGTVKPILDKFVPDAKDRLEAEQLLLKSLMASDLAQVEINKVEAASVDRFVSGWRPFIGWVCGASLAYAVLGFSFLNWVLALAGLYTAHTVPTLPAPDVTITLEILMAMLGLGGMRTYEKLKGVTK